MIMNRRIVPFVGYHGMHQCRLQVLAPIPSVYHPVVRLRWLKSNDDLRLSEESLKVEIRRVVEEIREYFPIPEAFHEAYNYGDWIVRDCWREAIWKLYLSYNVASMEELAARADIAIDRLEWKFKLTRKGDFSCKIACRTVE